MRAWAEIKAPEREPELAGVARRYLHYPFASNLDPEIDAILADVYKEVCKARLAVNLEVVASMFWLLQKVCGTQAMGPSNGAKQWNQAMESPS